MFGSLHRSYVLKARLQLLFEVRSVTAQTIDWSLRTLAQYFKKRPLTQNINPLSKCERFEVYSYGDENIAPKQSWESAEIIAVFLRAGDTEYM